MQTYLLGSGNELWSRLFPLFRHNQIFVCVDQQIKGPGNFQQGQERHRGGDLSDQLADLVLDRFLRLLSGCAVIFGSLVTLDIKLPSFKDLTTFDI